MDDPAQQKTDSTSKQASADDSDDDDKPALNTVVSTWKETGGHKLHSTEDLG